MIKSCLNYIGGKYKLLPQILPLFPKNIDTFIDLFCGGCSVGINVKANEIYCNDNLTYLIDMYNGFKYLNYHDIISSVKHRIDEFKLSKTNIDGYNKLRNEYNSHRVPLDLFILSCYSFNHQIRFNNKHELNISFGKDRSCFNKSIEKNLDKFILAIKTKDIEFTNFNFDDFNFEWVTSDDFVYCDPPYYLGLGTYNDSKRGFTGWTKKEEYKLLEILDSLNDKNIKFGLSNLLEHKGKKNDILKDWITKNNYYVHYLNMNYSNSNYQSKNTDKETVEVLITNYLVPIVS